ncbi:MAG: hypothetical protein QOD93_2806 [Acetobacteraceae bacterium]|nr:hypothetical protein [Acetobacteraceae bacterium]
MRRTSLEGDDCPVARSLDVIGDWWSLLIIRNAMVGTRRFSAFQKSLGIAKNMLAARLRTLVANGILDVVPASGGGTRHEYVLTIKGRGLFPVMVALRQWGEQHLFEGQITKDLLVDRVTGQPIGRLEPRAADDQLLHADDVLLRQRDPKGSVTPTKFCKAGKTPSRSAAAISQSRPCSDIRPASGSPTTAQSSERNVFKLSIEAMRACRRSPSVGATCGEMAKRSSNKKSPAASNELTLPEGSERILGLAVNTLGRCIVLSLAQRTAEHGVLPGAYPVIAWLMYLKEATQTELSKLIGIKQPTMAVTLRRMERGGIIQRTPDPDHGRKSRIKLTARGRQLSDVVSAAAHDVQSVATKGLSAAELDEFYRLAGLMIENLNTKRRR